MFGRHFEVRAVKDSSPATPPTPIVIEPSKLEAYAVKSAIFGVSVYGAVKLINTASIIAIARLA